MTSLTGVAWNRTHSECCPLIGVRVAGVEITESVSHWYFEIVDWGNVYVHVVKYSESILAVRNQKGLKGYFLKRKKNKNSNHNFLKILISSEIWNMKKKEFKSNFFFELYASELFSWKEMIKNYVYKCVFGMGVMYLVFHTTLFLSDQLDLLMYCFAYTTYIFTGRVAEEAHVIPCGLHEPCCIKFRVICVVLPHYVIDLV